MVSERNTILVALGMGLLAGLLAALGIVVFSGATADAADESTPDLLPGVDLDLREIQPGVFRVRGDGIRDLRAGVSDVTTTPDGSLWVVLDESGRSHAVRLGEQEAAFEGPGISFGKPTHGDAMALGWSEGPSGRTVRTFEDGGWALRDDPAVQACSGWHQSMTADLGPGRHGLLAPNGSCWISVTVRPDRIMERTLAEQHPGVALVRVDRDGDEQAYTFDEIGIPSGSYMGASGSYAGAGLAVSEDGTVWAAYGDGEEREGIVAFDGESWSVIPLDDGNRDPNRLFVGPDGDIYYASRGSTADLREHLRIFSWDGQEWAERSTFVTPDDPWLGGFRVGPDDSVWFAALDVSSDPPTTLTLPDQIVGESRGVSTAAAAPDGSVWVTVNELVDDGARAVSRGLYVVTPEAVAGIE